jgi:hypothetical protein
MPNSTLNLSTIPYLYQSSFAKLLCYFLISKLIFTIYSLGLIQLEDGTQDSSQKQEFEL